MRKKGVGRKQFDGRSQSEVVQKLEQVWGIGGSDAEAAFFADISKAALSDFLKKNPRIAERKEALKENPILLARQVLLKGISGDKEKGMLPNPELALKFLERKLKKEFSLRREFEHSGKDGSLIKLSINDFQNSQKNYDKNQ